MTIYTNKSKIKLQITTSQLNTLQPNHSVQKGAAVGDIVGLRLGLAVLTEGPIDPALLEAMVRERPEIAT